MSPAASPNPELRLWSGAGATALVAHGAALGLVLLLAVPGKPPAPETVMEIELPPATAPNPAAADAAAPAQPQQVLPAAPAAAAPPMDVPPVNAPLPREVVAVAPPRAQPAVPQPAAAPAPAAPSAPAVRAAVAAPTVTQGGDDPRVKKQELDYFSLIAAHLNRRKSYPTEAKKARQQGVVTVRFTLDRQGGVSGISLKRGSGFDVLDRTTLDLVARVAPYPKIPASLNRDSVTLSLPIDYSLRTD
jgi:protein TonB